MFSKVGHGTQLVGLGIARFRAIFGMKGKKLVPHHTLETMAMGKQGAMLYGLTQGSEFLGVGMQGCHGMR